MDILLRERLSGVGESDEASACFSITRSGCIYILALAYSGEPIELSEDIQLFLAPAASLPLPKDELSEEWCLRRLRLSRPREELLPEDEEDYFRFFVFFSDFLDLSPIPIYLCS